MRTHVIVLPASTELTVKQVPTVRSRASAMIYSERTYKYNHPLNNLHLYFFFGWLKTPIYLEIGDKHCDPHAFSASSRVCSLRTMHARRNFSGGVKTTNTLKS